MRFLLAALLSLPLAAHAEGNIQCNGRVAIRDRDSVTVDTMHFEVHEVSGQADKYFLVIKLAALSKSGIATVGKRDPQHVNNIELSLDVADYGAVNFHLFAAKDANKDAQTQPFTISLEQVLKGKTIASADGILDCTNLGN